MSDKLITVQENGDVLALYDDNLPALGKQIINRASHVEPSPDGNGWNVTLSNHAANGPWKGQVIGRNIRTRREALDLEVKFIQDIIMHDRIQDHESVQIGELLRQIFPGE